MTTIKLLGYLAGTTTVFLFLNSQRDGQINAAPSSSPFRLTNALTAEQVQDVNWDEVPNQWHIGIASDGLEWEFASVDDVKDYLSTINLYWFEWSTNLTDWTSFYSEWTDPDGAEWRLQEMVTDSRINDYRGWDQWGVVRTNYDTRCLFWRWRRDG